MSDKLVPVRESDYLDNDPPLRGQNYVCLSFLSPEEVVKRKEHFFFSNFLTHFSKEMSELFENLSVRYPKDADNFRMLKERYNYLFDGSQVGDEFNFYVSNHGESLQKLFDEENNFQTSIRGIKVRGVFETIREAQIRAEVLKKIDGKFNVYVAEVGCWCPWSPNPDEIQEQEFAETHLNTMMKHYKENQTTKDAFYEERKRDLQFMKVKKGIEGDEDPWMENKQGDIASSSTSGVVESQVDQVEPKIEEVVNEMVSNIVSNVVLDKATDSEYPPDI
jgi:hypothetical protein